MICVLLVFFQIYGGSKVIFYENNNIPVVIVKNVKNKNLKNILIGELLYLSLYNQTLSDNEVFERIVYIVNNYFYMDIGEKSIIIGMLKLSKNSRNEFYIRQLILLLNKYYTDSSYKWLGFFILTIILLVSSIKENALENYTLIQDCTDYLFPYLDKNHFYNYLFLYITNYYLSEYYLQTANDFFLMNKFPEAISNLEKVFVRCHINSKSAKKGLLMAMEIFAIINNSILVDYYFQYILETKDDNFIRLGKKILKKYYNITDR